MNIDPLLIALGGAVFVLIVADRLARRTLAAAAKVCASLLFLMFAIAQDVLSTTAGTLLFVGLVLSFVGDVALLSKEKRPFLVGLGAFLLAHVAYAAAFAARGVDVRMLALTVLVLAGVGGGVLIWLMPHVKGSMRAPVVLYVVAISAMVALAGALIDDMAATIVNGAVLFMVSDLFVARERFVRPGGLNRPIGLPLYYAGQVLLILGHAAAR